MELENSKKGGSGEISPETRKDMETALKKISKKQRIISPFYRYYNGKHRLNYASEKFRTQFGERLKKFADNLCRTCVTAPADRLEVTSFADEKKTDAANAAWEIWKYSSMPRLSKRVHKEAFKTGDGFAIVWADENDKARIYPQDSRQCAVWYNAETMRVERGARLWRDEITKKFYLTLYYTDRIEKFISKGKYETASDLPQKAEAFEIRTVEDESFPLANESGVCPMFHFGLENSILSDVIPLNDALNKEICDLLISSEANSRRERWTTGISYLKDDETGKNIIPWGEKDQYKTTSNETAKFGEFSQVQLSPFLESINDFRMAIARVTGIPVYYFMLEKGQFPSGEALRKAESRFTAMLKDAQNDFGESWSQAVAFALWIDNQANESQLKQNLLQTNWTPADPMSENEKVELANKKKNLGLADETLQSEIGMTDAAITKNKTALEAQRKDAAENFKTVFDQGAEIV